MGHQQWLGPGCSSPWSRAGPPWVGVGLTPVPEKVADFFLAGVMDFRNAGSKDCSRYRRTGDDLDGLAERLAPFHEKTSFE